MNMGHCDLRTYRECACEPGQCRVQRPVIEILREANSGTASLENYVLIGLAVFIFLSIAFAAHAGFSRAERAHQLENV